MTQISSEYRNAQMIFEIIGRNKLGIYSMEKSSIGFNTLIIHEMSGSASMVFQTFAGANAWMLECKQKHGGKGNDSITNRKGTRDGKKLETKEIVRSPIH